MRWLHGLCALGIVACTTATPPPSEAWIEDTFTAAPTAREALVLIVDDGEGTDAANMRQLLREGLVRSMQRLALSDDPGAWNPVSWKIVVALPSREGSERWIGPITFDRQRVDIEAIDGLVEQVTSQFGNAETGAFRPLAAARDLTALLEGARPAADPVEASVVEEIGSFDGIRLAIAASRDDESTGPVEAYDVPSAVLVSAIFPEDADQACLWDADASVRLTRWLSLRRGPGTGYACGADQVGEEGVFEILDHGGLTRKCLRASRPIADGSPGAACRVLVEPIAECDPLRGWALVDERCEVPQLEGSDLASCRAGEPCQGCASGWCLEDVTPQCPASGHPNALRFTGGAVAGSGARFDVVCELEAVQ